MDRIYDYFIKQFEDALAHRQAQGRRLGAELKFPLVHRDGRSVDQEMVFALWRYLSEHGWKPIHDKVNKSLVGAHKPGLFNDTVGGSETGFSKIEFSLAHVADLHELKAQIDVLHDELQPFAEENEVLFLAHGIHPVSKPSERLMIKKQRTNPWGKVFGSNRHIAPEDGDDVHLFTVNTASHVHVGVALEEAIDAVNVYNGFAGAQIALTAHSGVWCGKVDERYKCVSEKLWDWWIPEVNRTGIPTEPFRDIHHYVDTIAGLKPVYVTRDNTSLVLTDYDSFAEYFGQEKARGYDEAGNAVEIEPRVEDIDLHNSCYWYTARISRYFTVENRANDQQPPGELLTIAALTLGLIEALEEAKDVLSRYEWEDMRRMREAACQEALAGSVDGTGTAEVAGEMLEVARRGLQKRGRQEEEYLEPLMERCREQRSPADRVIEAFNEGGMAALLETCRW